MDDDEGGGAARLGKKVGPSGEVDYQLKAGTAWSHSYLNQKPWHPLSYPNQRRKWIAEQTHAERQRRSEEVAREFAQEQEFFRQTALFSKKEKEKVEMMKAVSFMYVRPPGYNVESAKAAEIADEKKRTDQSNSTQDTINVGAPAMPESTVVKNQANGDKKSRPKDVFGRTLPTEEEFEVLKNAPRLETGMPVRIKPFAVEVRNVRCVRCGTFGHQSGDRECPLKDAIMPNEENRLKRDDPLTSIMAQTQPGEPLKWELKHRPGMSPPRGGFQPDDPNQQIVGEDIFDEYGGFLGEGGVPALFMSFSSNPRKKSKHKNKKGQQIGEKFGSKSIRESEVERRRKHLSGSESEDDDHGSKRTHSNSRLEPRVKHKRQSSGSNRESEFGDVGRRRSSSSQHEPQEKHKHRSSGSERDKHERRSLGSGRGFEDDDNRSRMRSSSSWHEPRQKHKQLSPATELESEEDDYGCKRSSLSLHEPREKHKHQSLGFQRDTKEDDDVSRRMRPKNLHKPFYDKHVISESEAGREARRWSEHGRKKSFR